MAELHVNLDPIAMLRQARKTGEPETVAAALLCELAGAAGVTAHLKQDARHTEERDVRLWKETLRIPVTLVLNVHDEMLKLALHLQPSRVVLVSERRDEAAPTSGLDLLLHQANVARAVRLLHDSQIRTFAFLDPDLEQVKGASKAGVDGVVFNSLRYAEALGTPREAGEHDRMQQAVKVSQKYNLPTAAYRGVGYRLAPKLKALELLEVHCGHAIAARALATGFERAVAEMAALLR